MFNRSKMAYGGLNTVRINIGKFLEQDKDEDAYLVLTELPIEKTMELKKLGANKASEDEIVIFFSTFFGSLIVEHNLHETETELMSNEEVVKLIRCKTPLMLHVMTTYTKYLFHTPPSRKEGK